MGDIFADTSGWANYFVRTESFHQKAKQFMQRGTAFRSTDRAMREFVAREAVPR